MWLSVKSSLPVQCQPLHEEGRLCRHERAGLRGERAGLRGESPPLEAGIPAQALGATELCALGNPTHTHTHLTPTPTPGLRVIIPATSAGQLGGTGTKEGGLLAQRQGDIEGGAEKPTPPSLQPAPLVSRVALQRH